MGTVTLTPVQGLGPTGGMDRFGDTPCVLCDLQLSNSYATGGDTISPQQTQLLSRIDGIIPCGLPASKTTDVVLRYLPTGKVQAFRSAASSGTYTYTEGDIKGSVNTNALGAGNYITIPVNGALISILAASDNTTAFTIAVQPDIGRNVGILIKDATGGNVDGNAADYVIVGTFRGAAQTETISFTAPNLATMSNGNIAAKYGVKPFDSITSITPSAAQPTGFQHGVGPGSLLGLPVDPVNNAESDIIKLFKNAADLSKTGLYSTANKTVNFGVLADGDDISVEFNAGAVVAGNLAEVGNTVDLSGFKQRCLIFGG